MTCPTLPFLLAPQYSLALAAGLSGLYGLLVVLLVGDVALEFLSAVEVRDALGADALLRLVAVRLVCNTR